MKSCARKMFGAPLLLALVSLSSQLSTANAQETALTYQGRVTDNGTNFTGLGQFEFALVTSTNTSSQATATATMSGTAPHEFVNSFNLVSGGSGYVTAPNVTVSGGGGMSIRAITSTNSFTINVVRVDTAAGWDQQLRVNWQAWQQNRL